MGVQNDVIPYAGEPGNAYQIIYSLKYQPHFLEAKVPIYLYMYKIIYTISQDSIVLMVKKKKKNGSNLIVKKTG